MAKASEKRGSNKKGNTLVKVLAIGTVVGVIAVYVGVGIYYNKRFLPNVSINGVNVSGLTTEQAQKKLGDETRSYILTLQTRDNTSEQIYGTDIDLWLNCGDLLEEMLKEGYVFGGEQSGHVIFKDFASTGDGQLTSIQLLSLTKRSGKKLSELMQVMKRYPQCIINVTVSKEGKLAYYTDTEVKAAIEEAKKEFGETGRLVVRPSGTEPLIRVMTEGEDRVLTESIAKRVSEVIKQRLGGK